MTPGTRTRRSLTGTRGSGYKTADLYYSLPAREPCPTPHKDHFPNRKAAKAALKRFKGSAKQTKVLHAYRCQCGRWHLGAVPQALRHGTITRETVNAPRPA